MAYQLVKPGRVAQSVGQLTRKSEVLGSIPGLATYFRFSFPRFNDQRGAVVSYWRKYVHEVLVNRLGGLSLPSKSVVIDKISGLSCQKVAYSITSPKIGDNAAKQTSVLLRNTSEYIRCYPSSYCTV